MKLPSLGLILLTAFSARAALIHFDLSPPGTDAAVGISHLNEVPPPTNSTGTGNTISGGIVLNTDTFMLLVTVGYGSAAGFTDLSGPAIAMHIHSPAGPGTNAGVLVPLTPYNFPAQDPAKGGVIYGKIAFPTNAVSNLLAGLDYINIHTMTNPGGEIRGQLIPAVRTNSPPMVSCPAPATIECGSPALVTAVVADPDGDALTVVWSVNGTAMETNTLPASEGATMADVSFLAPLPLGTNHISVMVTDTATNSASCSTTVTVVDTTPPVISSAHAEPDVLWPPDNKLVEVRVHARVTDPCDATTWKITGVTSSEPSDEKSGKHGDVDWIITGDHTVKLRAEKAPHGNSLTYTITIKATDASGNVSAPKTVTVTVPKSQGKG